MRVHILRGEVHFEGDFRIQERQVTHRIDYIEGAFLVLWPLVLRYHEVALPLPSNPRLNIVKLLGQVMTKYAIARIALEAEFM